MKLPRGRECGKHLALGVGSVEPALSGEEALRYILARSEAVEDGAPTEAPRAQGVVDRAGEVRCQVVAGRARGFIDREICGTRESEGRAAEGKAIAAVRAQGWSVEGG